MASWAPIFFREVHGVALDSVGRYTVWPMVVGMAGKFGATALEASLLAKGVGRLAIRKGCNTCAAVSVSLCTVGFALTPSGSPALACAMYCGSSLGHCLDYPGFVANSLEVKGEDIGIMGAYSNTLSWVLVFLFGRLFASLKQRSATARQGWHLLLLGPLVLRTATAIWYLRYASVQSARSQLCGQPHPRAKDKTDEP